MQIRVLGCSGGIFKGVATTSFLLDDDILIDAGTGVAELTLAEMRAIRRVFITHSHLDHIASLPLLADTMFDSLVGNPLIVHAQPQTLQVPRDADPTVILNELNRELRMWMMSNQRPPRDFQEFISTSGIQVPPAPAGKKYDLSKEMRIELVDQ